MGFRTDLGRWGLLVVIGAVAASCGGGGASSSSGSTESFTGGGSGGSTASGSDVDARSLAIGDSVFFSFNSGNDAALTFDNTANPDAEYLLIINTANSDEGFSFALSGGISSATSELNGRVEEIADDPDGTGDFHRQLRQWEDELANTFTPLSENFSLHSRTHSAISEGSSRSFKVLSSLSNTSSCTTITATAELVTEHFVLYSDSACPLSESEIASFSYYDAVASGMQDLIGEPSDVDDNGVFYLIATCAINNLGASSGGFVTGFFFAGDLYDRSDYSCSNEAEIIYMDVPDPSASYGSVALSQTFWKENLATTVPPHELQHLISYNQHVLVGGGSSETSALNETLSHLFEDYAQSSNLDVVSNENPSRAERFLSSPNEISLLAGTDLAQRGGGYLFVRYLCEQANLGNLSSLSNCDELLSELVQTDSRGIDNIEQVTGTDFETLFSNFALTLGVSNRNLTTDSRYNFLAFNLYDESFDDNRGTDFTGPATSSYSNSDFSIEGNSMIFLSITADIVGDNNVIDIDGGSGAAPYGHLVRVQ